MSRRAVDALAAVPLLALAGCFPAVMHGPEVRQGVNGVVLGSYASGPTYVEGDEGGIRLRNAPVGAGIGHGWRAATPDRPSFYVGAFVPVLFPAASLDLYVQAPKAWTGASAGGLGLTGHLETLTPYLQWGRVSAGGTGLSTFQGFSLRTGHDERTRSLAWIPGVIAHLGEGTATLHLFAMGAVGHEPGRCAYDLGAGGTLVRTCPRGRASRTLLLGGAVEFHRRRSLR